MDHLFTTTQKSTNFLWHERTSSSPERSGVDFILSRAANNSALAISFAPGNTKAEGECSSG